MLSSSISVVFLLLAVPCSASAVSESDKNALMAFRSISDSGGHLSSWNNNNDTCSSWLGLTCSYSGRVTQLVLENLSLSAPSPSFFPLLFRLDQLRVLSLKSNSMSGPLPLDFSPFSSLKLLYLSRNSFSGGIPAFLPGLYRLDLSFNNLSGPIPSSLSSLSHLLTLRLESNSLSGQIPAISIPSLADLNLSSNDLSGSIPPSLDFFPAGSFTGNPSLCGAPLPRCISASKPEASSSSSSSSSPTPSPKQERRGSISRAAVAAIVAGDFAALALVSAVLFCYFWRSFASKSPSRLHESEKIVYSSSSRPYGCERGRMVFFEGARKFELEELLRASAEMLGKGGFGTTYKAVLDDGGAVAVKRLRDSGKRDFEQSMELLGRLRHPNLVPLTAYYFAGDEKLLVYEYMPSGSLSSLLHGNRGPGRTALDWEARVRIATGAARGLAFLHNFKPLLAHGNVKSANVLLDKAGDARLGDVGLALIGRCSGGERAQRADVHAFGVVLLELLTGRAAGNGLDLPRWVQSVVREEWTAEVFDLELMRYKGIEEEMLALLQIALACTALSPHQRPKIAHVLTMIQDIRHGGNCDFTHSDDSAAAPRS